MDCVFCSIIKGEIPSYTIYEDDLVKCFLDIHPDSNGETLIIPKQHFKDLMEIDEAILLHIIQVAKKLIKRMEEKLHIDGVTLIQNNGDIQEVKHFHIHLKPYYKEEQPLKEVETIYSILKED